MQTRLEIGCEICRGTGTTRVRDQRAWSETYGEWIEYPCSGCHLYYQENRLRLVKDELRREIHDTGGSDRLKKLLELLEHYDG